MIISWTGQNNHAYFGGDNPFSPATTKLDAISAVDPPMPHFDSTYSYKELQTFSQSDWNWGPFFYVLARKSFA